MVLNRDVADGMWAAGKTRQPRFNRIRWQKNRLQPRVHVLQNPLRLSQFLRQTQEVRFERIARNRQCEEAKLAQDELQPGGPFHPVEVLWGTAGFEGCCRLARFVQYHGLPNP